MLILKPGMDYVIIASSQVADARYDNLTSWLESALEGLDHA